ncbi:TIM44-like domain-containing protein [Companilactobacillus musae]|uniref:TIM44-like domain-containing protein n=1 Tax=Companilactobacillus musae TaxID=1903258 RepID=UPI000F844647|nr:TIM44-like domain-containing protein [Companilactobacillus musae]
MKKIVLLTIFTLSFLFTISTTPVSARAGGSMGSGSTTSSSSSTNDNDNNYRGYRNYNSYGYNRLSLIDFIFMGFVGFSFFKTIKRRRQNNFTVPKTYDELHPKLKTAFEPFFYKVEDAWTKNDLETLNSLMSPHYYFKQKRIINSYIRNHKTDHLDSLVIVDLQQAITNIDEKIQVIVTAQARDYFQYDNKSAEYNQQIQEDTNIERFTEIWTLTWKDDDLQLCDIKPIS